MRVWLDLDRDDDFDWDAEPPMPDYLPDPDDPQAALRIPIVFREIATASMELGPPE